MKKYKLIKEYPGSPKLDTKVIPTTTGSCPIYLIENSTSYAFGHDIIQNNPEFWKLVVEKDYEILTVNPTEKNQVYNDKSKVITWGICNKDFTFWSIHSVKRLSDGEIFTINDNTKYGCIDNFYIKNDHLLATTVLESNGRYLKKLEKIKQLLFTTEDGVNIFEGDVSYEVKSNGKIKNKPLEWFPSKHHLNHINNNNLNFSTKEKAEEYVLMNKKSLSVEDVLSVWSGLSGNTRESLLSQSILMFRIIKFLKNK